MADPERSISMDNLVLKYRRRIVSSHMTHQGESRIQLKIKRRESERPSEARDFGLGKLGTAETT